MKNSNSLQDLFPNVWKFSLLGSLALFVLGWLSLLAFISVVALIFMFAWNMSIVDMFGAVEINFWQSAFFVVLMVLIKFIFSINIKIGNKTNNTN